VLLQERYGEAEELCREALLLRIKLLGTEMHEDVLTALENLANAVRLNPEP
jgi:hypothetical protein